LRNFGPQRFSNPYNGAKREEQEKIVFLFALISAIFLVPEEKSSCRLRGSGLRWVFPARAPRVENWGLLSLLSFGFSSSPLFLANCYCLLPLYSLLWLYVYALRVFPKIDFDISPTNTHTHIAFDTLRCCCSGCPVRHVVLF